MIEARFTEGVDTISADGLWQYDVNQDLVVYGLDLPKVTRVDFSLYEKSGSALQAAAVITDESLTARIPNSLLWAKRIQEGSDNRIYAFIYLWNDDAGETIKKIKMKVKSRPAPEDADSPGDMVAFGRVVEVVSELAEQAAAAEAAAKAAEESAGQSKDSAKTSEDNASESETQAKLSAEAAKISEDNAKASEESAVLSAQQAKQGAEQSGYIWLSFDNETGKMQAYVTDNLKDQVVFVFNSGTGKMEVHVNG